MVDDERSTFEIVRECCSESTTHGIPYMFKRDNIGVKIFWLISTLISAGVCGWLVGRSILDFMDYETVTQSRVIFETPTYFPAVSICSLNAFTTEEGFRYVEEFSKNANSPEGDFYLSRYFQYDIEFLRYSFGAFLTMDNFTDYDRKAMGYDLTQMLLSCYFNNDACNREDFKWFFDPYYGSCYTFNSGEYSSGRPMKDKINTQAGTHHGLQLELAVGNPMNVNSYAFVNGIHVIVHNKTDRPTYLRGIKASVGHLTEIEVSRTFSERLKQPYSDCVEDIETTYADKSLYVRTILETNYTYKQTDCFNVCLQKYIFNDCGCYMAEFPFWNKTGNNVCLFRNAYCTKLVKQYFFADDLSSMCDDNCPLECKSILYSTSSSIALYPSDIFASRMVDNRLIQYKLGENLTIEELRSSVLAINVYYPSLSFQSFSEVEKTSMVDLIAGIGGTLGLFLGVSFLSFIELFDLVFCLLIAFYQRSKNKNNSVIPFSKAEPRVSIISRRPSINNVLESETISNNFDSNEPSSSHRVTFGDTTTNEIPRTFSQISLGPKSSSHIKKNKLDF